MFTRKVFGAAIVVGSLFPFGFTMADCGACPSKSHKPGDIVETAVAAGQFQTLVAAVKAAGLVPALQSDGPLTVFAPTDAAFGKLPEGTVADLLKPENRETLASILKFHVVSGELTSDQVSKRDGAKSLSGQRIDFSITDHGVTVDGARIEKADIHCSNGIIHVIDRVILPSTMSIVETADEAGTFKTLLAALGTAGLTDTLASKGPFTVFAPSDQAFAKLSEGTVESLLKPENRGQLVAILTYHVVPGRIYADDARKAGSAKTLQGQTVKIRSEEDRLRVGDATVVARDVDARNGVIHIIDRVLLPAEGGRKSG